MQFIGERFQALAPGSRALSPSTPSSCFRFAALGLLFAALFRTAAPSQKVIFALFVKRGENRSVKRRVPDSRQKKCLFQASLTLNDRAL